MSKHAGTIIGAVLLVFVVLVVIATQSGHDGHRDMVLTIAAASPTPSAAPSVLTSSVRSGSATPHPARASTWDQATGAMAHVTLLTWLLALGILPLFALAGIALHARHRARLVELDHPPLRTPEFVHRAFDVKALEARRGWLPESFTYSPHMRNDTAEVLEEPAAELQGPLLTAQQALDMPGIVYGQRLDTGEPLVEQRVLSLAIGGRPGSGKTSTALLLAAQYVRLGAELRVADPHSGHPGSLLTQLEPLVGRQALGWVAETPRETLHLVDTVADQLEQRKGGWRRQVENTRPLVLLIDEFAESLRLLPPRDRERLLDRIQVLGYSGRKYDVACVLLAQSWLTGAINSSQVRNPLRAAVVHSMRADEGRALTGLRAEAWPTDPVDLSPGEAYVLGVGSSGLIRVRVPLLESPTRAPARTSAPNSELTSHRLPGDFRPDFRQALVEANGKSDGSLMEVSGKSDDEVEPTAEDWRIAELFDQGLDIAEIARKVFDAPASGRRHQEKSRDVQAALRRVRQATR